MTHKTYNTQQIIDACDTALKNIEEYKDKVWLDQIDSMRAEMVEHRKEKAKRTWFRWFPKPFAEPTEEEISEQINRAHYRGSFNYTSRFYIDTQMFEKSILTIKRVMTQAESTGVDSTITVSSEDWQCISKWSDLHNLS